MRQKAFKPNNGVKVRWTKKRQHEWEYIYVLSTSASTTPFYVGRTYNLESRLRGHVKETLDGGNTPKCARIRAEIAAGNTIKITEIDRRPFGELGDLESHWIEELGYVYTLTNSKGGDDPHQLSAQQQQELREAIQEHKKHLKERRKRPQAPYVPPTPLRLLQNQWCKELIELNPDQLQWPDDVDNAQTFIKQNDHLILPDRPFPF